MCIIINTAVRVPYFVFDNASCSIPKQAKIEEAEEYGPEKAPGSSAQSGNGQNAKLSL
jgi:hypothetical protein